MTSHMPRVGVLVVAYNAASTLDQTLRRLPQSFAESVDTVLVCDDASNDDTYEVGLRFRDQAEFPMTVVKHEHNLGYGGNQKAGYRWAQEHGLDVVVLLHGDGQYAPEYIEDLVGPLVRNEADAVFGSRMLDRGSARAGGMPAYKYLGNRVLTTFQNAMTGLRLSEWHSGYRAYRVDALRALDLESYSDGFDFDTEIILGLIRARKHIAEVPIPTFYGDEICYVNGVQYARDIVVDVMRHWAAERGRDSRRRQLDSAGVGRRTPGGAHSAGVRRLPSTRPTGPVAAVALEARPEQSGELVQMPRIDRSPISIARTS